MTMMSMTRMNGLIKVSPWGKPGSLEATKQQYIHRVQFSYQLYIYMPVYVRLSLVTFKSLTLLWYFWKISTHVINYCCCIFYICIRSSCVRCIAACNTVVAISNSRCDPSGIVEDGIDPLSKCCGRHRPFMKLQTASSLVL